MFKSIIFAIFFTTFFLQPNAQAIKYKVTDKEFIERCYDWDIYRTSFCPFPVELRHLCDDCRYDGEGKNEKNGNIIPNGSGNFSNIVIENLIPPNPNPSSEEDFELQIFETETLCIDGNCNRHVRPRVPIISVADIEPEPEVNENNRNVRTRYGFNFISFEPPSQNWNFNNEYISRGFANQYGAKPNASNPTGRDLDRIFHGFDGMVGRTYVNVKEDVRDDGGNITGFNINTYRADTDKSKVTFMITTEANNTYTLTFNLREFRGNMSRNNFANLNTKEWSEEFLDGSPAVNVAFVGRNVVKAGLVETNFHEIQNTVGQETVKVGEVEIVKEVEIKVEKKDVKVPQNVNEALISMGAPSAKQKEFIINKDLFYPAKIATDALILNYNGEFKNGVPHGKGTVTILNPKTNLKYGLYGDYKINLYGTFRDGVFKKLNEIYYPISGNVFKFPKGEKPYESKFTRHILHGPCSGNCKKIKISLDNINLGKQSKKFKNMPAISNRLISQTQLFANNTPTILSTHATIEMEDNKGNILPTLGINLPPLAKTSLFTLPGYNDFTSSNYININDSKKVKELKLNILNLKKTDLENKVKDLLQNSEIKDRKELIKKAKKISKKYKIPASEFIQKEIFEHISNDEAHNNQPMTADFSPLIDDIIRSEGKNLVIPSGPRTAGVTIGNAINAAGGLQAQRSSFQIADYDVAVRTLHDLIKPKIDREPKKHQVDSDFLKKSQSGNIEKKPISNYSSYLKFKAADPEVATRADSNLVGGNVITNVFGVLGFAEQVISFLNNSRYYGDLEFSTTMDIDYVLKSMIETNLPSNSSLDLEDEYVKKIFEISNVEKLALLLEIYFKDLVNDRSSSIVRIFGILKACEKSELCNESDFYLSGLDYGVGSESMKKIIKVVKASKKSVENDSNDNTGDGDGGGDGW